MLQVQNGDRQIYKRDIVKHQIVEDNLLLNDTLFGMNGARPTFTLNDTQSDTEIPVIIKGDDYVTPHHGHIFVLVVEDDEASLNVVKPDGLRLGLLRYLWGEVRCIDECLLARFALRLKLPGVVKDRVEDGAEIGAGIGYDLLNQGEGGQQ